MFTIGMNLRNRGQEEVHPHLIALLLILSLFFTAGFFILRWLLRPIRLLSEGVRQVSEGNLDHRVPSKGSNEFTELADSFNEMTRSVREMIQAREQLLLDVSHELRTPLTRMKVAVEFLPDSHARENIEEDIREMEHMVTEILETARFRSSGSGLDLAEADFGRLIYEVVESYAGQLPGVETIDLPEGVMVKIDRSRMKTVLGNIVSNAMKFSPPEGAPVQIHMKMDETRVVTDIADRGEGIPEEEISRIFEPFYRVDKSRTRETGGYGLGLSLCKTIMEAHGGRIEVENRAGGGTRVRLTLPVA
jgi:signal transduction histidine kinase